MTTDLPPEFAPAVTRRMTDADRSFTVVMSRVLGPEGQQAFADMILDCPPDGSTAAFDDLPADADEATRHDVAKRMVPYVRALHEAHPGMRDFVADSPQGRRFASQTVGKALRELYNPAQIDVLNRVESLLKASDAEPAEPPQPA